jgi:hypothetical protein
MERRPHGFNLAVKGNQEPAPARVAFGAADRRGRGCNARRAKTTTAAFPPWRCIRTIHCDPVCPVWRRLKVRRYSFVCDKHAWASARHDHALNANPQAEQQQMPKRSRPGDDSWSSRPHMRNEPGSRWSARHDMRALTGINLYKNGFVRRRCKAAGAKLNRPKPCSRPCNPC